MTQYFYRFLRTTISISLLLICSEIYCSIISKESKGNYVFPSNTMILSSNSYYLQNGRYYYTFPLLSLICNHYSTQNDYSIQLSLSTITNIIYETSSNEKSILFLGNTPFLFGGFEKTVKLSKQFFEKNLSYYEGGSFVGNITISKDYLFVDGFSLSMGTIYRSNNHYRKLLIDVDFGLKGFFPLDSKKTYKYRGEKVVFVTEFKEKESGERKIEENAPVAMVPLIFSIQYHQHIKSRTFLSAVIGFSYLFTGAGNYWYYKNDVDSWLNGINNKPRKIDGKPDHPVYQGIVPYFGLGIKF